MGGLLLGACAQQPISESVPGRVAAPDRPAESVSAEVKSANEAQPPQAAKRSQGVAHAHSDHDSKHGGTFFMALDNKHHLEGVLLPTGVFRVFIYDEYSRPLKVTDLGKIRGKVIWGEADGSPEIPLLASEHAAALEAKAPGPIQFPVVLTLLLHFPGMAASERPELFTFPFSHYSPSNREGP
jgi:hypothetical protein